MLPRAGLINCLIIVAVVAAAILVIWPVAQLPYGDDTTYTYMALSVSRTGHFAYNGWQTALLLVHVYWGAIIIRLFGFSFNVMRLSTIPLSVSAVAVCYLLVRRAGLQDRPAMLTALMLGLSPLFLPVAVSYMTDGPALLCTFISICLFSRSAEDSTNWRGFLWLLLGTGLGFIGGTSRQTVWLVPLVVLPYLAWVRRRQSRFAITVVAAWVLTMIGTVKVMAWFGHQPYSIAQPSLLSELKEAIRNPLLQINSTARLLLMLLLVCLPVALPLALQVAAEIWRGSVTRKLAVCGLLAAVAVAIFVHPSVASIPWVASTLNWEGINGQAPLIGRPVVLTRPIRAVVAIVVFVTACLLAGDLGNIRGGVKRVTRWFAAPTNSEFTFAALSLFSIVYFGLVILRGNDFDIFDRYLLPVMPWAATAMLLRPESGEPAGNRLPRVTAIAWGLLGVLSIYAVSSTQDLWALARARATAAQRLERAGVSRTEIDAGFEYNAWTELLVSGKLNSRWVRYPPGAYRAGLGVTPSVVPAYRLEYEPEPGTISSAFGSIQFSSLLPPFHKQVSVDRVVDGAQRNE